MIVVIEGADGSGKTTLARYLTNKLNAAYHHHRPYQDPFTRHLASLRRAAANAVADRPRWTVVDRLWPSEHVYGDLFRGGGAYPTAGRCLDRLCLKHAVFHVLCVPSDEEAHRARFESVGQYRPELEEIAARYRRLVSSWPLPVDGAREDYLRTTEGLWHLRTDVLVYDVDRDGGDLDRVARRIIGNASAWRSLQYTPALLHDFENVAGHLGVASTLMVGDEPSPRARPGCRYPFVFPEDAGNSSCYLNRALTLAAVQEYHLAWTNANFSTDEHHLDNVLQRVRRVVALGRKAEKRLRAMGVTPDATVPHPQWWRRFHYHDLAGYAFRLAEAITY